MPMHVWPTWIAYLLFVYSRLLQVRESRNLDTFLLAGSVQQRPNVPLDVVTLRHLVAHGGQGPVDPAHWTCCGRALSSPLSKFVECYANRS